MSLNLDKSTWEDVRFGDVVKHVSETMRGAAAAGIDRVIGLEHLDPNELAIVRWGDDPSSTTFTKRVRPGQTLFGKRRAYQRKAAYAEFEAITSGDILTFEAIPDRLLPELLPFLVQSEPFFANALETSAGSLSPRTNWGDLAKFEFALPPLPEQRRLADLLWAAERHRRALAETETAARAAGEQAFANELSAPGLPEVLIGDVLDVAQYGSSEKSSDDGEYPILGMGHMSRGRFDPLGAKYIDLSDRELAAYRLEPGDVLFNRTNSAELVGRSALFDLHGDYVFASYLVRLRPKPGVVSPEFLNAFINSVPGQAAIRVHVSKGVSQANISPTKLKTVLMPVPTMDQQLELLGRLDAAIAAANSTSHETAALVSLRASVLREVFG